jgi:hypothetical protein
MNDQIYLWSLIVGFVGVSALVAWAAITLLQKFFGD